MKPTTEGEIPKLKAMSAIFRVRKVVKRRKTVKRRKETKEEERSECR